MPRILALAYPGIGSRALDWEQRLAPLAGNEDLARYVL